MASITAPDAQAPDVDTPMPHRLAEYNPAAAILTGASGFAVSAASGAMTLVGQAVPDASSIPQGGLTVASLAGAAVAGLAFWSQLKAAKRREDAADKAASVEMDAHEYETWGARFAEAEKARARAEGRIEALEERVRLLTNEGVRKDDRITELLGKIDHLNANVKQGASLSAELNKHTAETLDEVKDRTRKTEAVVKKLAESSGVGLDTGDMPTIPDAKG